MIEATIIFYLINILKGKFQITNQTGRQEYITFVLIIVGIASMIVLVMIVQAMLSKGGVKLSI